MLNYAFCYLLLILFGQDWSTVAETVIKGKYVEKRYSNILTLSEYSDSPHIPKSLHEK